MCFPNHDRTAGRVLTSAEITILQSEITSDPAARGYAGKNAHQIVDLINSPYLVPNPAIRAKVNSPIMTTDLFFHILTGPIANLLAKADTDPLAIKYRGWIKMMGIVQSVDANLPQVTATLNAMLTDALLTQADIDAVQKVPDPAWQATVQTAPRADVIFTPALTIEPADVTTATGVN